MPVPFPSFVHLPYLFGVLAAGIPFIIHLIHRRRAPRVLFSTLRFLRISARRTARRRRLEELLLLLLRAFLFALLALAIAGPYVKAGMGGGGATSAVIVLDNSYSLGYEHQGKERYSEAKEVAQCVLKGLKETDFAALVFTNGPEAKEAPGLTRDLEDLSLRLAQSVVSRGRANLARALKQAYDVLAKSEDPTGEIYVISDGQKLSWSAADVGQIGPGSGRLPVGVVRVGEIGLKNLGLRKIEVASRGRVVGKPIVIQGEIFNSSPTPEEVMVSLYIDGAKRAQRQVSLGGLSRTVTSFTHTFTNAGIHTGWLQLPDDPLRADNKRSFTVRILERLQVLVVKEEEVGIPFLEDDFYLLKALAPVGISSPIDPHSAFISNLDRAELSSYAVVFLVGPSLDEKAGRVLVDYVKKGGRLVLFMGEAVGVLEYNEFLKDPATSELLLPGRLLRVAEAPEDEPWSLTEADFTHPLFHPFQGAGDWLLRSVLVNKFIKVETGAQAPGKVLASLGNGSPFLLERKFAKGRVLLVTTTAGALWTNFPVKRLFLPLMHEMVYYLTAACAQEREFVVGSEVRLAFAQYPQKLTVRVTSPSGRTRQLTTDPGTLANECIYEDTFDVGIYRYEVVERPEVGGAFVLNPDPDEADLSRATEEEIRRLFASRDVYFGRGVQGLKRLISRVREGVKLDSALLFMVLGLAIFECFLANRPLKAK